MKFSTAALAVSTALLSLSNVAAADPVSKALVEDAKVNVQFRARFEQVDQLSDTQDLTSLRTRLTYQTGDLSNFFGLAEVDDVRSTDEEPWIADYEYTEINQAFIGYKAPGDTVLKYGRQRILLDNQRFVGGVGFRQNEQTYDAFSVQTKGVTNLTAFYAYINNVNRIFSEASGKSDHKNETHLLNLNYKANNWADISGYAYLIDNQNVSRFSTDTYGVRLTGKGDVGSLKLAYALEYAKQSDGGNNTLSYDADYQLAEASLGFSGVTAKLGYEVLGSDNGNAGFITPLATLHAFQGWTDKFLFGGAGNWDKGIEDLYFSVGGAVAGVKLLAVYHQFESDVDNIDMGDEWGVSVTYPFAKHYSVGAKYASFSGADAGYAFSNDTDKLWLTFEAKY
ncbi:alginate export family protein [Shewanella sp. 3B26]|uniref:Alginate export family protein n=1 Tax=Shewanella zhuhaiensis TaxID=2919576 RepID=A0AAJ1BF56_9GAMM|nr:alginate export family protein [Shewanella zhuhaiensis]MCH4293503.1 alginate export family protein [Shewanella zhuhaiensis]